jgi:hypothetical protein
VRTLQFGRTANISVIILLVLCVSAYADGISLDYFIRFHIGNHAPAYIWTMIGALMAANYVWNFVVIGWPAIKIGSVPIRRVSLGLISLTLLGQIADRVGAFATLVALSPFEQAHQNYIVQHIRHEQPNALGQWVSKHEWLLAHSWLILNFLFSGAAVAFLTWFFLRRWSVPRSVSWKIMLAATILTNPAWTIALLSFHG